MVLVLLCFIVVLNETHSHGEIKDTVWEVLTNLGSITDTYVLIAT